MAGLARLPGVANPHIDTEPESMVGARAGDNTIMAVRWATDMSDSIICFFAFYLASE